MNIHEYQAKELLRRYGVPVPEGRVAATVAEAVAASNQLPGPVRVVKAQIHAGGRGKAGGVRLCRDVTEVEAAAAAVLGSRLVTHQNGPDGTVVRKLWIEQGTEIADELYLAVVLDPARESLCVVASPSGGMDIEAVAAETPERIHVAFPDAAGKLWPHQAREILFACGLNARQVAAGTDIILKLYLLCLDTDATLAEINPLAVDAEGRLLALDAKMNFDDSALGRHPDIAELADPGEADAWELRSAELGISYVRLGGSIGTLVNGAGLAMATMDAIAQAGGEAANFLDAGGGADASRISAGFALMLSDPNVRGILVNIFGGILRCDIVAEGVVQAARELDLQLPLVVRMEGTNVDQARAILAESGLAIHTAVTMTEAAAMVVELTKEGMQ
ncbi:MAG: ADP-forming succinate--CoA ligase subunit beta [Planctomycetaceae bacterium]|nr:ADP-forming succinate--CoA ligase subunit beta [Planctomycetaceae bacterium]